MFLKQSDQTHYGHLLKDFRQSYANKKCDLYPDDLASIFKFMRTFEVNRNKNKRYTPSKPKEKDEGIQPGA